ncbi:MAG: xylulokinase [Rubrobacteraceae bacterium]
MGVLLGLDVGTTGVRAIAVDESGALISEASSEYPLHTPHPGWTEQDPEDWWRGAKEALAEVAGQIEDRVVGIGLTGQMHGSVFLDSSDEIIRPALLWNDQRTEKQCENITEAVGQERLIQVAGNPALTGFQAPKVLWLRDEEPENYEKVSRVLLPKDYVRLQLTGEYATDVSDAAGTLFLDVGERNWSREILEALEVPKEWMPAVYEGPEASGNVRESVAEELGLPSGIPVAAGGGDNAAAAVGVGVIQGGVISSSVGTSGVIFAHTGEFTPDPSGGLHAFCHAVPGAYHLMGVTLSAGGSLAWWHDTLDERFDYEELSGLAAQAPPGAEGLLFLPYLSGERTPHSDPAARGSFFGLTNRHEKSHMTRALMEGVIFSLKDSLEIMRELGTAIEQVRATGGGARGELWRRLQADIYGLPIHRTTTDEGPAYGAALLAGVAAGVYEDVREASSRVELRDEVEEPAEENVRFYEECHEVYRSLYPATRKQMRRLADLAEKANELDEKEVGNG